MSNKLWNVITHHEAPAFGVGDYDEYYEIVNQRGDALQSTEYEGLEQIADALNSYQGNLRITTALEINLHCDNQMLKSELEQLKAENSKMRKALEPFIVVARHARNFPHPQVPVERLRAEATLAESKAEHLLGAKEYHTICESAFKDQ